MNDRQQTASIPPALDAFGFVRDILLDSSRDCVDRVTTAWSTLRHVSLSDLPPSLADDWAALAERTSSLVTKATEPLLTTLEHEAGDIGTLLLCYGWLARHPDQCSIGPGSSGLP
jgi:hypothetical protein